MEFLALVYRLAEAHLHGVAGLIELDGGHADLAVHGLGLVVEALAGLFLFVEMLQHRAVILVEGVGVFLGQPVQLVGRRDPGVEGQASGFM